MTTRSLTTMRRAFAHGSVVGIASIAVLLLAWEAASAFGFLSPFYLPALSTVLRRIWSDLVQDALHVDLISTLYRTIAGFSIACILGLMVGIAMATTRPVRWFLDPLVSIAFPMPKIVFLPIFILWLGVYDTTKIFMIVFDSILPVVTATIVGINSVDKFLIWSARSIGTSRTRLLTDVYLPAATPSIVTGIQVALPIALIVNVVCEMLMGGTGIGARMMNASRFADITGVCAGLIEIGLIGFVLIRGMAMLRQRLLRWHAESHAPSSF